MIDIAAQQAVDGRRGKEAHALTAVITACKAGFAFVADDIRLDGDAVAGFREVTSGLTARIVPADSWPRMWLSVTTMGPMQPACQKWTSELSRLLIVSLNLFVQGQIAFSSCLYFACKGHLDIPADSCTSDFIVTSPGFRAPPEATSLTWLGVCHPEVMI